MLSAAVFEPLKPYLRRAVQITLLVLLFPCIGSAEEPKNKPLSDPAQQLKLKERDRYAAEAEKQAAEAEKFLKEGKANAALEAQKAAREAQAKKLAIENEVYRLPERARYAAESKGLRQAGKLPQAIDAWQRKIAVEREVFGNAHEEVVDSLLYLTAVQEAAEDFTAERKTGDEILTLRTQLYGEKDWRVMDARLLLNHVDQLARLDPRSRQQLREVSAMAWQAVLRCQHGHYREDLPLLEQARDLNKNLLGEQSPYYAAALDDLANFYHAIGNSAQALRLLEQVRDLRKQTLGEEHPAYARCLNDLALLHRTMRADAKALPLLRQASDIRKRCLGEKDPGYAQSLNNLGVLYRDMGDLPTARTLLEQAFELRNGAAERSSDSFPDFVQSLNNLVLLYHLMGMPARVLPLLQESMVYSSFKLEFARATLSSRVRLDLWAQFRTSLDLWLSFAPSAGIPAQQVYRHAWKWKGVLSFRQAEEEESVPFPLAAQSPRALQARALEPSRLETRQVRAELAHVAMSWPTTPEQRAEWRKRFDQLEAEKDRLESRRMQASDMMHRAMDQPEVRMRSMSRPGGDIPRRLPDMPGDRSLTPVARSPRMLEGRIKQKFAWVDFLAYNHFSRPPGGKGPFRVEERLVAFIKAPDRPYALVPLGPVEAIEEAVEAWHRAVRTTLTPTASSAGLDAAGTTLARLVWKPLQEHLKGVDALVIAPDGPVCSLPFGALPGRQPGSYVIEELSVSYVTSGRHLLELASTDPLSQRSLSFDPASPFRSPEDHLRLLTLGDVLYGSSPDPLAKAGLPAELRQVWEELPGTRLEIEHVERVFRAEFPINGFFSLTGDQASRDRLVKLLERGRISKQRSRIRTAGDLQQQLHPMGGPFNYRQRQASPIGGRELVRSFDYLHVATHAYFASPEAGRFRATQGDQESFLSSRKYRTYQRNPLLSSGLVLAGANRSPEAGILTAEEIADLDLRGVQLAVLSACQTGLGRVESGAGVLGLQWAFHAAGARTLVTSLWSVDDAATSVLMEEFYTNLWKKKWSTLDALRQAQLTVLHHPERVEQRVQEFRAALAKRGVPEERLAQRGLAEALPVNPRADKVAPPRSPPTWWAAFVLSGDQLHWGTISTNEPASPQKP
jgi:CHAT domain-containing protein